MVTLTLEAKQKREALQSALDVIGLAFTSF